MCILTSFVELPFVRCMYQLMLVERWFALTFKIKRLLSFFVAEEIFGTLLNLGGKCNRPVAYLGH